MRMRAFTGVLAVVAATLAFVGCGGSDTTASSAGQAEHNQADITFAQGMIPHHAQAIEMAQMAAIRAQSPEVKKLAKEIEAAQGPEIRTMTGWLQQWGTQVPSSDMPGPGGMDPGGMNPGGMGHGGGMMSPEQMGQLGHASGAGFDRMFLQMMIQHHEGALVMARTEIDNGKNPAAIALAEQIIRTQQAEIQQMRALLAPS